MPAAAIPAETQRASPVASTVAPSASSGPASRGPAICPTEKAAVNQPKPASRRPGPARRAIAACPAMVKARWPTPSTAEAAYTAGADVARARPAPPAPIVRAPAATSGTAEGSRSVARPIHSAPSSGSRA